MKQLNRNIWREFEHSWARLFSVAALLMLGTFVFVGLNTTGPDMQQTAQASYQKTNLADAQITTPLNFDQQDRSYIRKLDYVQKVTFGHSVDVLLKDKEAINLQSVNHDIATPELTSGHLPQAANEIALSKQLKGRYHVGDTITFKPAKNDQTLPLKRRSFKVTGFITSTEFLKTDSLGMTSAGTGELKAYGVVGTAAFKANTQNIARVRFSGLHGSAYSNNYENEVKHDVKSLQSQLNHHSNQKVARLTQRMNTQLQQQATQLATAEKALDAQQAQLPANVVQQQRQQLQTATMKYQAAKTMVQQKQTQLKQAKMLIKSRNDYNDGYNQFGEDIKRINTLGQAFPMFFFLIAILVSFTTMNRMVEEKRIESGTLRALGYTKGQVMRQFLLYSSTSAVLGTVVGALLGTYLLPRIIFRAYAANFDLGALQLSVQPLEIGIAFLLALASTTLASWLAAHQSLKEITADLMLPKPPASGSRILLERIGFIWNKMHFSGKVTARNLFRYKSRMLMTIIGVAGATALLITGFGMRDSLNDIVTRQFGDIERYDVLAAYNPDGDTKQVNQYLNNQKDVSRSLAINYQQVTVDPKGEDMNQSVAVMTPQHTAQLQRYIKLNSVSTHQRAKFSDNGALVTQKLAKIMNAQVGDTIRVHAADGTAYRVKIAGIVEMYEGHSLYMTPSYYHKVFHQQATANARLVSLKKDVNIDQFSARYNRLDDAVQIVQSRSTKRTITNILANLNNVVIVLIVAASLLSLVVLYTLTNINVSERMRELSTLKVLGFYPKEVLMYIYRETNILTGLGIVVGMGLGYGLHAYIMGVLPPANAMTAPGVTWLNLGASALITIVFSLIVMWLMNRKIQSVDMLEALKSVD